mgnify:CR=1 FL=1
MKLLLTSGGLSSKEIIDSLVKLVEKKQGDISVAVINEAFAVEKGSKRWVIDELANIGKLFEGEIDIVDLLALSKEEIGNRIKNSDVIYVLGGHTDYLMSVYNKSGFAEILPVLLKDKVYVGSSAGSMVACQRVSTGAYWNIYGEENDFGAKEYLNLTDFAIKPHLDSADFPKVRKDVLQKVSSAFDKTIFGLRDDQAILINDGQIEFVGGKPLALLKGEVL